MKSIPSPLAEISLARDLLNSSFHCGVQVREDYGRLLHKLAGAHPEGELLEAGNTFVGNLKQVSEIQSPGSP
jgi:hypothetical protein